MYIADADYKEWTTINKRFFRWQSLEYMADQMGAERVYRESHGEPRWWKGISTEHLMRMKRRIQRVLGTVDCPDYVPPRITHRCP
jgi:hypothetical protein